MAESTYHQMSVQHIRHLAQYNSPVPVRLVHQQQPQSLSHGAQHQLAVGSEAQHLDTVQCHQQQVLERECLGLIPNQQQRQ